MQEITRQAEQYGIPSEREPAPSVEKMAETGLLKAPTPWSGPAKIEDQS